MKRVLSILLAVLMLVVITACGANGTETNATETDSILQSEETTTEKKVDTSALRDGFNATIEETVMVDEAGIKITAMELDCSGYAAKLNIKLENNSDQEITFLAGTLGCPVAYINDYMMTGGYLNETVAPGMTANEDITFSKEELIIHGIKEIGKIGIAFKLKTGNDDYLETGVIEVKTSEDAGLDYGKDTFMEAMDGGLVAAEYEYTVDHKIAEKLFEGSEISTCCAYVITNSYGEQSLLMEVQNNSSENKYVCTDDIHINDICVCGGTWSSDCISPGKRKVIDLCFDDLVEREYLEMLEMDTYGKISFKMVVEDSDYNELENGDVNVEFDAYKSPDSFSGETLYENNGLKFMKVGIIEDTFEYSEDVHVLVLVKNDGAQAVNVDAEYDGTYVNSVKVSSLAYTQKVLPGGYALMDVEILDYDLEDNGLNFDSITDVTVQFDVRDDNYHSVDSPIVTVTK